MKKEFFVFCVCHQRQGWVSFIGSDKTNLSQENLVLGKLYKVKILACGSSPYKEVVLKHLTLSLEVRIVTSKRCNIMISSEIYQLFGKKQHQNSMHFISQIEEKVPTKHKSILEIIIKYWLNYYMFPCFVFEAEVNDLNSRV